jgi:hypothetical protein
MRFGGYPPGYGDFPARKGPPVPGFDPTVFWVFVGIEILLALFFLFPRLFGFKKSPPVPTSGPRAPLPPWFWVGAVISAVCLMIFWGGLPRIDALDPFMNVPIWWGLILVIDGVVFHRNGGRSLISVHGSKVALMGGISAVGWFMFEYLDFFVLENWYYPNQGFTQYFYIVWLLTSYTGIFPLVFEYYQLFRTFPKFSAKYRLGPKVKPSRVAYVLILILGLGLSWAMGRFPSEFFLTIWVSPVLILWAILGLCRVKTPFTALEEGDWSAILMSGLAMLICGLGWEFVNFGSEALLGRQPLNPIYWKYNVPYVGTVHLPFSQMPIVGYMGYIPYAWICWLQWIAAGKIFGFDSSIELDPARRPKES